MQGYSERLDDGISFDPSLLSTYRVFLPFFLSLFAPQQVRTQDPHPATPWYAPTVILISFPVGPLGCNCSIIGDEATRQAIVVDPGGDFERIREAAEKHDLTITSIVHTHTHIDHVGATAPLQRWSGAEAHIHEADRFLYQMLPVQAQMMGMPTPETCDLLGTLKEDGTVRSGGLELGVIHTPGHTPGSVSFLLKAGDTPVLFSGDTLFQRGIGRTDLWGGDSSQIMASLRNKLMILDGETRVITGHGPPTCIEDERRSNPFLQ